MGTDAEEITRASSLDTEMQTAKRLKLVLQSDWPRLPALAPWEIVREIADHTTEKDDEHGRKAEV
jgi:hypothetical protein